MSFLTDLYQKSLADSDKNIKFWEEYLNNLTTLDFNLYSDNLKVPVLVPIGSRVFFRGEIQHTNEVTVALGADYFVKCSVKQAEVLRQHRIKDAKSKLELYKKEKEYIESQITFNRSNVLDEEGQDIIETYSEEEDKAWRLRHRENVRKYKQKAKAEEKPSVEISNEELWNRLEELELEEELANELRNDNAEDISENSFIVKKENLLLNTCEKDHLDSMKSGFGNNDSTERRNTRTCSPIHTVTDSIQPSNFDMLQKVLEKQHELENKLSELKTREKPKSKTESDLISKLDEMEALDELEDEIDRLDDMLNNRGQGSDGENESTETKTTKNKLKKSISFADNDDDDSGTLELEFKHSEVKPSIDPYDPKKGITKPSDIYEAYSYLFGKKITSILSKKSKYGGDNDFTNLQPPIGVKKLGFNNNNTAEENSNDEVVTKSIVIRDVVEKSIPGEKKVEMGARPTSLFKKKRMQQSQA